MAPTCVNLDSSAANSETCTCGSSECDATKGLFCLLNAQDPKDSTCTKSRANPDDSCVGCKDLVGAKSGIAWEDVDMHGCDYYTVDEENDEKKICAFDGAVDEGEGAANAKW